MYPVNHRQYRRIDFHAQAAIQCGKTTILGEVYNLCNKGIYIKVPVVEQLDEDDASVSLCFTEGPTTITITMPAKVVRKSKDGIAFHSPHINMYSILHLEHLFIYRKGKPDQLTEDFCEYISCIPLPHNFARTN